VDAAPAGSTVPPARTHHADALVADEAGWSAHGDELSAATMKTRTLASFRFSVPSSVRVLTRAATALSVSLAAAALVANAALAVQSGGSLPTPNSPPPSAPAPAGPSAKPTAPTQTEKQGEKPAAERADATKFLRYVRVGANGAKARNIYDAQGMVVLDAKPQEVLAVYSERAGWLEVEAAGGFSVWVFGEYLAPAADAGVLQVTGDGVLMRPSPSSGPESLPLRQRLGRGEKLRLIGRKDMSKPMAEDWVNVWSPPRSRAWVAIGDTEALPAGVDGAKLWAEAVAATRAAATTASPVVEANAATGGAAPAVGDTKAISAAFDEGERLLAAARTADQAGDTPDYAAAKAAFEHVLELSRTGPSADLAQQRIKLCSTYEEAYKLTLELKAHEAARADAMRRREDALSRANRGVFDGRFDARGWVERVVVKGEQQPIYLLRFGGSSSAELVCTSGRLRLEDFLDVEVGVSGRELRGAVVGPTAALSRPRELDVTRLEVLSARRPNK